MRRRHYSHPQPSSGYAYRDKRWSGLILSNKTESYHLFSSVALISAQSEYPHLSRLKDTYNVTTLHCVRRIFKRKIKLKYFSISQAMYLGTQLLSILNHCFYKMDDVLQESGRAQEQVCQRRGALPSPQTHHRVTRRPKWSHCSCCSLPGLGKGPIHSLQIQTQTQAGT